MKKLLLPYIMMLIQRLMPDFFKTRQKYVLLLISEGTGPHVEQSRNKLDSILALYTKLYPSLLANLPTGQIPVTHDMYTYIVGQEMIYNSRYYKTIPSTAIRQSLRATVIQIDAERMAKYLIEYQDELRNTKEHLKLEIEKIKLEQSHLPTAKELLSL